MNVVIAITVTFVLSASATAWAEGNTAAGKEKSATCATCHGWDGNHPIASDIPKLAGQNTVYITRALKDYKSGNRTHKQMIGQAESLNEQDIEDLAVFYASQPCK